MKSLSGSRSGNQNARDKECGAGFDEKCDWYAVESGGDVVGIIVVILLNPQVFECGCDAVNGDVGGQRVVVGRDDALR